MKLLPLPAFSDNYIWMVHDGRDALVVDPGDAAPVEQALRSMRLSLRTILVTHHHGDHTGGVAELRAHWGAQVFGPTREAIPEPFTALRDGERLQALGLSLAVLDVPGHTAGHIAYYCASLDGAPVLFCGDTLFSGGCGRLFEGTPAQMHASLSRLAALPGDTRVCCAHEYTLANLAFAQAVEPDNRALADYLAHCRQLREAGLPTLPSTIAIERAINPFVRTAEAAVRQAAQAHAPGTDPQDPVAVLASLRQWKNDFR
ncbi:hydroxyacylglutathione hydrolase [Comamonas sp. NLF-1-9]|uniref:hydroxyacylglutathione hydrolase n=1 Tax=Comamonas sp. NLF-1-9 TaxID=2853163 RepID=UPI001C48E41E|nr:hydroxyacylglutathione hydrolase [Comamonas sp. NLF-1-9]QXL84623.1 hydroxyacylglutathione hydrolase [Comamonas sp. NLF-1-9]